jgi:hypothetical protein
MALGSPGFQRLHFEDVQHGAGHHDAADGRVDGLAATNDAHRVAQLPQHEIGHRHLHAESVSGTLPGFSCSSR